MIVQIINDRLTDCNFKDILTETCTKSREKRKCNLEESITNKRDKEIMTSVNTFTNQ